MRALAGLGSQRRAVRVNLPSGLPAVMADPPLMERVIANLIGNALRYSPDGAPPLLTARARGGRVELRVADRGPGVPPPIGTGCSRHSSGSAIPSRPAASDSDSRCRAA